MQEYKNYFVILNVVKNLEATSHPYIEAQKILHYVQNDKKAAMTNTSYKRYKLNYALPAFI
jgi:hypothetical protein